MIGIYKITNKVNGKSYIGQSNNIERRLKEHKYISSESNKSLKRAYKKYGKDNFEFSILEECKLEELDEKEIYYINTLKPEYNRTIGGNGSANHIVTNELKELLRIKGKQQWQKLTDEQKQKIIINNLKGQPKGHKVSLETREKLRICNLGKKQSKKTIEKRKQTIFIKKQNGFIQTNEKHKKPIRCIETGEQFESVKEAIEKYNLTTLVGHLKGRYKSCKGKHYEYCSVTTNRDEFNDVE